MTAAPPFAYRRPSDLSEALELLGQDGAMVLAGGTDLVTMRNAATVSPSILVDIKHVGERCGVSRPRRTRSGSALPRHWRNSKRRCRRAPRR